MRALIYRVSGMLSVLLILFCSLAVNAQTQEQIDEVNAYEQKIELSQNDPGFDMQAAQQGLNQLKEAYGMIPASSQENPVNTVKPIPGTSVTDVIPVAANNSNDPQTDPLGLSNIPSRVEEIKDQIRVLTELIDTDPHALGLIKDLQTELDYIQGKDKN